jgi:hypothetical protein
MAPTIFSLLPTLVEGGLVFSTAWCLAYVGLHLHLNFAIPIFVGIGWLLSIKSESVPAYELPEKISRDENGML